MSATETETTESTTDSESTTPAPGADGKDYTLQTVKQGSIAYLHGWQPVITMTDEGDGTVEVYRLGDQEFHPIGDLSTHRGPRPATAEPEAPQAGDRIKALEDQVAALVALLSDKGKGDAAATPASGGSGDEAKPAEAAPEATTSPFET